MDILFLIIAKSFQIYIKLFDFLQFYNRFFSTARGMLIKPSFYLQRFQDVKTFLIFENFKHL